jgi:hypothetical protein
LLQEQAPGAQLQLAQVHPEFPQPPILIDGLIWWWWWVLCMCVMFESVLEAEIVGGIR